MLEILKETQIKPMARIKLPHPCEDVVGWSMNNGILDITLKLIPQGSALDGDDEVPSADISVDFSDKDDDEDEVEVAGGEVLSHEQVGVDKWMNNMVSEGMKARIR